jgi:hypothetical protein
MKQLFCVKIYILVLLVCFLRLILHLCSFLNRLFWRVNQMTKNCRRFVSLVGHFR